MVFVVIFGLSLCLAAFFLAGLALATALNNPSPRSDGQSTQKHQTLVTVVVSQDDKENKHIKNVTYDAEPSVHLQKTCDSRPHPRYLQAASSPRQQTKGRQLIKVS